LALYSRQNVANKPGNIIADEVTGAISRIAPQDTSGPHLGFDTYSYPGDAAMAAWRDESVPYEWVGYYLKAPCHRDDSWLGKREKLEQLGWGVAVIYVGQQTWSGSAKKRTLVTRYVTKYVTTAVRVRGKRVRTRVPKRVAVHAWVTSRAQTSTICNRDLVSASRGAIDGVDAINGAEAEGFPHGTMIFLDIERMDVVRGSMRDYYREWTDKLLKDGRYKPGFYAHTYNADLIHRDVAAVFLENGHREDPRFWIAGGNGFSPESEPNDVGHAFADVWQGVLDVARTYSGIKLPIDISVAKFSSPSGSQNGE
jgi:hypothetical protein